MKKVKRFRNWIALVVAVSWKCLQRLATVKPSVAEVAADDVAPPVSSKPEVTPAPKPSPIANSGAPQNTKPVTAPAQKVATVELSPKVPSVKAPPDAAPANGSHRPSTMSEQSAQRLARVLISEIKLYYMSKMEGQDESQMQNIYDLLKDPIDKSRQHYLQRVGKEASMPDYFHGELVKTLCAGDASRLGPNYTNK